MFSAPARSHRPAAQERPTGHPRSVRRTSATRWGRLAAAVAGVLGIVMTLAPNATARAGAGAPVAGGDPIVGPGGVHCAVGFNVQVTGTARYALTAGQCGEIGGTWTPVGPVVVSEFPGNSYALLRYLDPSTAAGGVRAADGSIVDITAASDPAIGQQGCVSAPSGEHCGIVRGLNASVFLPNGKLTGLIDSNICTEPGDDGAPLYLGHTAFGIVVGRNGDCSSGGNTFFEPVSKPLTALGVSLS